MEKKEFTCICCPMGCTLEAEIEEGAVRSLRGNGCRRGAEYAAQEAVAPRRVVCSTVAVRGGVRPLAAVKTVPAVPREKIFEVMACIRALRAEAPLQAGDCLVKNIAGTGCELRASSGVERR